MAKRLDPTLTAFQSAAQTAAPKLQKVAAAPQALTREAWLLALVEHLRPMFKRHGAEYPQKLRVSCGWPSGRALGKKRTTGQYWPANLSKDGHAEIFISPYLSDVDTPDGVGATLVHELVHAVHPKGGHGPEFRRLATALGLEGKMRSTTASPRLCYFLEVAAKEIGPYPHATLDLSKQPKQSTRLVKVQCTYGECDFLAEHERPYVVRMSAATFEFAAPSCGACANVMIEAPKKKKKKVA